METLPKNPQKNLDEKTITGDNSAGLFCPNKIQKGEAFHEDHETPRFYPPDNIPC
jgi:hypothetical protein